MNKAIDFLCLILILASCQQQQPTSRQLDLPLARNEEQAIPEEAATYSQQFIVHAGSGLNYRDAPNGKVLGTYEDGTSLQGGLQTGVFSEIMDGQKALYGEWLGVEHADSMVYVFEPFLIPVEPHAPENDIHAAGSPPPPVFSPYILQTYYTKEKASFAYVPLPWSPDPNSPIIDSTYLGHGEGPKYHYLTGTNRRRFLHKRMLQETDKVFVYNYFQNKLYTYPVKDLPLIAHITVYGAKGAVSPWEYVIGFSLEEKWKQVEQTDLSHTFVYIGSKNPFARGQLTPMVWESISPDLFPRLKLDSISSAHLATLQTDSVSTFRCTIDSMVYYLQLHAPYSFAGAAHMIVLASDSVVLNEVIFEGEGMTFSGVLLSGQDPHLPTQWTGKLFKYGPPLMFSFFDTSFGCPWITLLDGSGKHIGIACDNRH